MKQSDQDRNLSTVGVPLAIIGIGCLFPRSENKTAFWATIREGVDAITEIPETHWRIADFFDPDPKTPDHTYGKRGGFLSAVQFNPMQFNIPPNAIEAIDTSQLLGLMVAGQALKDAGYGADRDYDRSRVSVILGVTGALEMVIPLGARMGHPRWREALKEAGVAPEQAEDVVQRISDSYVGWQENSFPGLLGNVVAGRISKQYDLGGTNCVVDAACASSFSALHLAGMELATGAADMVVTGGVDTFNDIFMYTCFSKTPALSTSGDARPFDSSADGTILGEGLGLVILKRLADAERDGDRIYAVIRGIGSSSDGKGEAIYTPSAPGQKKSIINACTNAGVTPDSIGLLEAHGTGTRVGDIVEISAARDIYGEANQPWCAISSVKSQIGHTKAAAGAAGLIKAALALQHRVIPPTIKVSKPLDEVTGKSSPFYITTRKRPWISRTGAPRRAAVSAFGFGGSNFHTILEEYRPLKESADWDGSVQLLAFSGPDAAGIDSQLAAIPLNLSHAELRGYAAKVRDRFDPEANCRLAIVTDQNTILANLVKNARSTLSRQSESNWNSPDGIFYATGNITGKTALLFPGQGAQYVGMLRDLACAFPQLVDTLEQAEQGSDICLTDRIYPFDRFEDGATERQESDLRATDIAQPAIGAVSLGVLRLLESFGFCADAAAGHSYGELTALCAAGLLDEPSFHRLSRLRGSLMAAGDSDKGTMLAVSAPLSKIEQLLAEEGINLVIANRNAPSQAVLSGSKEEIEHARSACEKHGITCKKLQVGAAFHSSLVSDAAAPFLAALADIPFGKAVMPVYANSTAAPYPVESAAAKELLAGQLARPVEFVAQIEAMYADGIRCFVEAGPGARLSGLVKAILGDRPHTVTAVDSSGGKRPGLVDLARCLAQLATLGYMINLKKWDEGFQLPEAATKKPLLTIPLCGANYVKPREKKPVKQELLKKKQKTVERLGHVTDMHGQGEEMRAEKTSKEQEVFIQQASADVSQETLLESLKVTREGMSILQKMQEETAQLHRRFLEGQESATQTILTLLNLVNQGPERQGQERQWQERQGPGAGGKGPERQATDKGKGQEVVGVLLAIVSEKTGYPVEMLELSMSMDADLGIDSIKRVEILSALQERLPGSPVIGPEQLGVLNTLGQIAEFLGSSNTTTPVSNVSASTQKDQTVETLLAIVSEKTGYPTEMLELSMSMDADLGIDSIKRVEILSALLERLPGSPVIGPEQLGVLNTLGQIAEFLGANSHKAATDATHASVLQPASESYLQTTAKPLATLHRSSIMAINLTPSGDKISLAPNGVIVVTDDGSSFSTWLCNHLKSMGYRVILTKVLDILEMLPNDEVVGLVLIAPNEGTDDSFLKNGFKLLKQMAPGLKRASREGGALFVTVSRLDGAFGCKEGSPIVDPLSGGLAGLSKTARYEWPDVTCKAIDLGIFPNQTDAAAAVSAELFINGPVEVGLTPEGRFGLSLCDLPELAGTNPPVNPGDLVVITGGGRGVTAAAAVALASAWKPLLALFGRSPLPTAEPEWLKSLDDEATIKRAILTHATGKLHPREIEERYQATISGRELQATIDRIKSVGGKAVYCSVDIRDEQAVADQLEELRKQYGAVRGIVHGAGVLADRLIVDKTREQFNQVYGTKVLGLRSLLDATRNDDLSFIALFGSTTGRLGRSGQVDYAVANEVLNKLAQFESRRRPDCRTVCINWGPWDGGMVTPALKKVFSAEGIDLIPLEAGAKLLVNELAAKNSAVEVTVLAGTSGTSLNINTPKPATPLKEALKLTLNVDDFPFISSHVIDNMAVLPMAMIVEWLASAALHGNPGFRFHGFNDLRICKGVIIDRANPCALQLMAGKAKRQDAFYNVPVELVSSLAEGGSLLHARAEIVLANRLPEGIRAIKDLPTTPYSQSTAVYDQPYLFHGPDLHGIEQITSCSDKGITALVKASPQPASWIKMPLRSNWLTDPLVMDSAFQMMILWSFERFGAGSLPTFAARFRQFHEAFPKDGAQVVIRIQNAQSHSAIADIEFLDRNSGKLIARLDGYECVIDPSLQQAFRRNQLPGTESPQLAAA